MRIFGMCGLNCKHELLPQVFQAVFEHLEMTDAMYQVLDIPPMALVGTVESFSRAEFAGVNILWPYQEYIMEISDEAVGEATQANAANMIVVSGDMVSAFNTNTTAMLQAIQKEAKFDVRGKQALLLGAGAAARCMAVALTEAGAEKIILANRTKERAVENAQYLSEQLDCSIEACGWDDSMLGDYLKNSHIVANCTFLGGRKNPDEMPVPELLDRLHAGQLVVDVTCDPIKTPFLVKAQAQGAQILPGYFITLYQCAASFNMWTNSDKAPIDIMKNVLEEQLKK